MIQPESDSGSDDSITLAGDPIDQDDLKPQTHEEMSHHRYKPANPALFPETYSAVTKHAILGALRSFILAHGIRGGITFLLKLTGTVKRRRSILVLFRRAFLTPESTRTGITVGLYCLLWKWINHALRLRRGVEDRWNGFVSGAVAGLAIAVETPERRETFAHQLAVRAVQSVYNGAKNREIFYFKHGDALLFIVCSAQVMYSYIMHPKTLPPGLFKFMIDTAEVPASVLEVVRSGIKGSPVPSAALVALVNKLKGTPKNVAHIAKLTSTPELIPCSLIHPRHDACTPKGVNLWLNVLRKILPVYTALNFVPMLLLRLKHFLRTPSKLAYSATFNTVRSSIFLAFFVASYQWQICVHRKLVGEGPSPWWLSQKVVYWMCGAVSGSSILLEHKGRRSELALYVLPKAINSFYQIMYNRRLMFKMPHFEVLLTSIASAIIMGFYQIEPEVLSPMINKVFHKLFGKY